MMKQTAYLYPIVIILLNLCSLQAQEKKDSLLSAPLQENAAALHQVPTGKNTTPGHKYNNEYLDTVKLNKHFNINNYSVLGFQYGISGSSFFFLPGKRQTIQFHPVNLSLTFGKYYKMFNYLPYFGFNIGLCYGKTGYTFKRDPENGRIDELDGATQAKISYVELPLCSQLHLDKKRFKIMCNLGFYTAYRLSIKKEGAGFTPEQQSTFSSNEHRFDYGLKGGLGLALVFSPIELHFNSYLSYSCYSFIKPDYRSTYFYQFAYPINIVANVGIFFHLSRRNGKTRQEIRKEAYKAVFEPSLFTHE